MNKRSRLRLRNLKTHLARLLPQTPLLLSLPVLLLGVQKLSAQNDPTNPTSDSNRMIVVPAPGPVKIDGLVNDWDLSSGIWSYNDPTLVNQYSSWTHVMWNEKGVYLLVRYHDAHPLKNATRGKDFGNSWRADAMQARLVFDANTPDEHQMHVNMFYSSSENRPYMIVHHGGFRKTPPYDPTGPFRQDQLDKYTSTMEKHGGEIAFKAWEDGKGYDMEVFWPWSYLRTNGQPLKAGEHFVFGVEQMWGNDDGSNLRHRLVDNLKDHRTNRIFFFRAKNDWGHAIVSDKGNLAISQEQKDLQEKRLKLFVNYDTAGTVPIKYTLEKEGEVTIAIDDANGKRVRNLFGQFPRKKGENIDFWDGLDDKEDAVPPGKYTVTILTHDPIGLKLVTSLYNAGTPPWLTDSSRTLWGSNHGHPTSAGTRGDVILLGFTGTEGTSGIMRVDENGKILWTDSTESNDITLTEKHAYLFSRESWTRRALIRRFDLKTGAIVLFENADRTSEVTLPIDHKDATNASTIAAAHGKIFIFVPEKGLFRLHPDTGELEKHVENTTLKAVTDREGALWGLFADHSVALLDENGEKSGKAISLTSLNLKDPVRIALSQDGKRFAISDFATNQVHITDNTGKLIQSIGKAYTAVNGTRPPGDFVSTDLIKPLGLDFDAQGRLWVAEAETTNRRVTLWNPDGKLNHQYWGGADYGAMAGFPLLHNSKHFVAHGVEFEVDTNIDILNRPTNETPLRFHPALGDTRGIIFPYKGNEYAVSVPGYNKQDYVLWAKRDAKGVFTPIARLEYEDTRKKTPGRAWIDKNENGKEDEGEVTVGFNGKRVYWSNGYIRPSDMAFITPDQQVYRVKEMTKGGVPIYDFSAPETLPNNFPYDTRANGGGTVVMDKAGNVFDGINYATADGRKGSYPNPYGRHDAPAARKGLLIAPFRTAGIVEDVPEIGSLTALQGDRGEWFLMSHDGLFISNLFQDSKKQVTLDEFFLGQESFGGFLWRDENGRVLAQLGGASYRIVEITGLDTAKKNKVSVEVNPTDVAEGLKAAQARRDASPSDPKTMKIAKVATLPTAPLDPAPATTKLPLIDGAETYRIQEPGEPAHWFRVSLAHDTKSLAIAYEVNDSNPWKNGEGRFTHAFIGGDAIDLQLLVPGAGAIRLLAAPIQGKNTAIYWQQNAKTKENPLTYVVQNNDANAQKFDVVKTLDNVKVDIKAGIQGYTALVTVPLSDLGIDLTKVESLKGIVGVIFSDASGSNRSARLYWFDKTTGLVSDVPSEARLNPKNWGTFELGK